MRFARLLARRASGRGIHLRPADAERMAVHYRLLVRWNPTVHLTSVTGEESILDRHFLESMQALPFLEESPGLLVDVGTGNGFPALPLLVLRAGLRGRLLEPATRKRAFLKEVLRETGLAHRAQVLPLRIHRPGELARLGPFHALTARAVGGLESWLGGAATGLTPGGRALLFVGRSALMELRRRCPDGLALRQEVPLAGRKASYLAVVERVP